MNYYLLFGDFDCLKAAVQNGANAVYLGANSFSARAKATNFDNTELIEAIKYAKLRNVAVHLALNTLIKNDEFEGAVNLAILAYNLGIDAIIIQDLGLATYLHEKYPEIPLHASTQMTIHNLDGAIQAEKLGFSRVVLARELSLEEIKYIRENTKLELEVFVHGALCISYSGQCLLSSMIGGRSGNRGLCAQPCRLPYELIEETINGKSITLDNGYLLSPRDNCAIELLPELIKLGINSFKIEGRMKTPTYVGIVTKIYRKYINLVLENINLDNSSIRKIIIENLDKENIETNLTDREQLLQVFNRGGFSDGHFNSNGNKNLIFKEKPNNMGFYLGTISHINENKGHLTLKLENHLSIGDKISINNESYTVSELIINNKNFDTINKGETVKIGRMKGNIKVGTKVFRIETKKLNSFISPTFSEEKNFKKIPLNGEINIKENQPLSLKVYSDEGFYKGLEFTATSSISPSPALNKPITPEKILDQISKTGNTEFELKNLQINLDNNLFVQMGTLNDLRRNAISGLESLVINKYKHNIKIPNFNNEIFSTPNSSTNSENNSTLKISLLINILDKDFDYTTLKNIDKLYIPLKFFLDPTYNNLIKNICIKYKTYIYLPHILKDEKLKNINFEKIISNYKDSQIKGFVISHISQIEKVQKYNLDLIGNFNLNIYNNYSINELKKLGIFITTVSPELDKFEIQNILKYSTLPMELIVYGKLPVMTNNYCYLGKSNKCYKSCLKYCNTNSKFYLKDRMNFKFRIIPDNATSTIYNSKILSIKCNDLKINSVRIDILDESPTLIQNIIDTILSGNRFEGKDFTNGKF